jgi:hypothetical protein
VIIGPRGPMPVFDHLLRLTDDRGLFEHAELSVPRRDHGYCVDDVARALVVVCRESSADFTVRQLERRYLDFVLDGVQPDGTCHNRMDADGVWLDEPGTGDWWGRALWGLGVAGAHAHSTRGRLRALEGFRVAARQRSKHNRAMSYAALGAAEVLRVEPAERSAHDVLRAAIDCIGPIGADPHWPWPEPRLRYANGTVAQALIVAGVALDDTAAFEGGLFLLNFLLKTETRHGSLSVTPVGGRGRGEVAPRFDQQPIEIAALADACVSAYQATDDPRWLAGVRVAWNWFLGHNDAATPMFDSTTGAGYDGLEAAGRNSNQGAESTLAVLSTAQHARWLSALR